MSDVYDSAFPAPECANCGHHQGNGLCAINIPSDGSGCNSHLYRPDEISNWFTPVKFHREQTAMEYEFVINCEDLHANIPVVGGKKVVLASRHLHVLFTEDSDRSRELGDMIKARLDTGEYLCKPQSQG